MKPEIRILGIDDAPFDKFKDSGKDILVVGTIFRGGLFLDGILSTSVTIDGTNSTQKLIEMVNTCKFKPQIQCIILDGIALGGFNVVDIHQLYKKTKIPVMVVIRKYPDFKKIKETLKKLEMERKITLIDKAGIPQKVKNIYVQAVGLELKRVKQLLDLTCTRSFLPEPIRVAHLIAAGIVTGESKGKA